MSQTTTVYDPLLTTFAHVEAMPDEAARQRFGELMWYADRNVALPDEELDEVVILAARFGVKLIWRHFCLKTWQWKEGRGEGT